MHTVSLTDYDIILFVLVVFLLSLSFYFFFFIEIRPSQYVIMGPNVGASGMCRFLLTLRIILRGAGRLFLV